MTNPKGGQFERLMADYLKRVLYSKIIDRRVKTGRKDKGDIANVKAHEQNVVVECKNWARLNIAKWLAEAETERINDDDALACIVIFKRVGKGKPEDQLVLMTARDFAAIMTGVRPL